jgi:putative ABC transport system ATP-binding protein
MNETPATAHEGPPALDVRNVTKVYRMGDVEVHALRGVTFAIARGAYVSIMGPSGSGKSTLMNLLGCLDRPTTGAYLLDGVDVGSLDDAALARLRLRKLGFVFQGFNLLPRATALKNVALPLFYAGIPAHVRAEIARSRLAEVGLAHRAGHRPAELSGGEQQRVAIARALANDPAVLLADEPTGNLDSRTSEELMALFGELNAAGRTIVMVTHDEGVAKHAARTIRVLDGRVTSDEPTNGGTLRGTGPPVRRDPKVTSG